MNTYLEIGNIQALQYFRWVEEIATGFMMSLLQILQTPCVQKQKGIVMSLRERFKRHQSRIQTFPIQRLIVTAIDQDNKCLDWNLMLGS